MYEILVRLVTESWQVLGQMAPYLLFGFLVAGVLSVCISPRWVQRHLGGSGPWPVVKAAGFGVPLPLCSCGVIPVGASPQSASVAAGAAWMLPALVKTISALALLAVLTAAFFPRLTRQARAPLPDEKKAATISIQGMHCTHCVDSVTRALEECAGVESADVDLKDGKAVVHGQDFDVDALRRAVEELGYSACAADGPDGADRNEG